MKIERREIIRRLKAEIDQGRPILGAGCSAGLIAKCAEAGEADVIIVYSTGKTRLMGVPTTMITGVSNPITLEMVDQLDNVVKDTPLIAGIEANDIHCLDLETSLKRFVDKGFSGVINFPTVGLRENMFGGDDMLERKLTESLAAGYGQEHWGWSREVEMIRILRSWDIFTMVYVLTEADAKDMVEAGADAVCVHFGPTAGGLAGYDSEGASLDGMLAKAQGIMDAARAINPDVICLIHGGPFSDPESLKVVYEKTDFEGFVAASAIERIPVEKAVVDVCQGFKNLSLGKGK
ncbi:phosphoenolpyruvate hydrolase family protein [Thalassotalea sp. PLHSN55]|uniref:phosphoenolpyruvate hydrolase family protein n=1 Tax=Thalassotalea sp. PLHSN55 TaxID=3435888 RepID=UPI003F87A5E9